MQSRPWGRRASSVWHRCVSVLLSFPSLCYLVSNGDLFFTGGAYDEGPNGPLHGPRAAVDRLKERAKTIETGLRELETWKEVQIKKLDLTKKVFEESEEKTEVLTNVLKDKEREVSSLKKQVRHAKEDVVKEFRDFDAFLYELGGCFTDSFNDYLC